MFHIQKPFFNKGSPNSTSLVGWPSGGSQIATKRAGSIPDPRLQPQTGAKLAQSLSSQKEQPTVELVKIQSETVSLAQPQVTSARSRGESRADDSTSKLPSQTPQNESIGQRPLPLPITTSFPMDILSSSQRQNITQSLWNSPDHDHHAQPPTPESEASLHPPLTSGMEYASYALSEPKSHIHSSQLSLAAILENLRHLDVPANWLAAATSYMRLGSPKNAFAIILDLLKCK